jgi:hypothetical protein
MHTSTTSVENMLQTSAVNIEDITGAQQQQKREARDDFKYEHQRVNNPKEIKQWTVNQKSSRILKEYNHQ